MLLIILFIIYFNEVAALPKDTFTEALTSTDNVSRSDVEVYLSPSGSDSGLIQILLPNRTTTKHLCYPDSYRQHQEAVRLLHVLCRQLGFVTFGTRYKEIFEVDHLGVLSTSAECTGHETSVSQCPWQNVKVQKCRKVLGTRCTSCYKKISARNGTIHNPGFPHTYLYPMTCDWTIQVPEDKGILLTFEQFALPRHKEYECESYLELAYSHQKSQKNRRICPLDLPESIRIQSDAVRIRFSSGIYRQEYDKQQTHYGFNIVFRAIKLEAPNNHLLKVILISVAFVLFFLLCLGCYCCRRNFNWQRNNAKKTAPTRPPPTLSELEVAADDFHRCKTLPMQQGQQNKENKQNGQNTVNFSIFQSESSSTNSVITRWRSQTNLPVTSALAPLGPERRMLSLAMTPRTAFPESPRKWSEECAKRIDQVRTKLLARFSTTSSHNQSDISVFFPAQERRSYSKLSNEDEIPLKEVQSNTKMDTIVNRPVPEIVIEFVD